MTQHPEDELRELMEALCEGLITPEQMARLEELVGTSPKARDDYIQFMHVQADLITEFGGAAPEGEIGLRKWMPIDESGMAMVNGQGNHATPAPKLVRRNPHGRPAGAWIWTKGPHRHWLGAFTWGVAIAATILLAVGLVARHAIEPRKTPIEPRPAATVDVKNGLAMVLDLDGVDWEPRGEPHPVVGELLGMGRLRFRSGRVTLSMLTGVFLIVEGPADIELMSCSNVLCHWGKIRARVSEGTEGFVVSTPKSAVIDLGTEFGVNVERDFTSRVKVFKGQVEAGPLGAGGVLRRSRLMRAGETAFEIDPDSGSIKPLTRSEGFVASMNLVAPRLSLGTSYPDEIRASRPWSYWRFETMSERTVPNEVLGRPVLHAHGPIHLTSAVSENQSAVFEPNHADQYLTMDGFWEPPSRPGYAVEFWFLPDSIQYASLVAMSAPRDTRNHLFLLETTAVHRPFLRPPLSVRFLHRWPPAASGGDDTYAAGHYVPYRWHHIVAQKNGDRTEIFLNGVAAPSLPLDAGQFTAPCQLVLGRLTTIPQHDHGTSRPFSGRMDEVALYNRPLAAEEVRRHYAMATRGTQRD